MELESFYKHYLIEPMLMLSECQYDNEMNVGVSYGDDVCEHLEDDYSCEECSKSRKTKEYYPSISDYVLLSMLLIVNRAGHLAYDNSSIETEEKREEFIKNLIAISDEDEEVYNGIKEFLIRYVEECSKF